MIRKMFVLLLACCAVSACSAFRPYNETITIMTNQPDSSIYVNGQKVGRGTAQTRVKRSRNVQIMASKPGYHSAYQNIDSSLNVTGILDIVGTFFLLYPVIGVFFPGSKSLDRTNVALELDPLVSQPVSH